MTRIGHGFDVHAFTEGRPLVLGGVTVPSERGLAGHSDADVLAHALMDAILGAMRAGDIGQLFPDTDPAYEGADSDHGAGHGCRRVTGGCQGNHNGAPWLCGTRGGHSRLVCGASR